MYADRCSHRILSEILDKKLRVQFCIIEFHELHVWLSEGTFAPVVFEMHEHLYFT